MQWAAREDSDTLLDPSCGDGRFIARHANSVGVERDGAAAAVAGQRAPCAELHRADFFSWAEQTTRRFDCAAGNPPFIRYQTFKGEVRRRALRPLRRAWRAVSQPSLSPGRPSWSLPQACFEAGGRMAFVVPASIGHAPYAAPLDRVPRGPGSTSCGSSPSGRSSSRTSPRTAGCCSRTALADRPEPSTSRPSSTSANSSLPAQRAGRAGE